MRFICTRRGGGGGGGVDIHIVKLFLLPYANDIPLFSETAAGL